MNLKCLLKPVGGSSAAAAISFSNCSRGKLSNAVCKRDSIAQTGSQQGFFFPFTMLEGKIWMNKYRINSLGKFNLMYVRMCPDACVKVKELYERACF